MGQCSARRRERSVLPRSARAIQHHHRTAAERFINRRRSTRGCAPVKRRLRSWLFAIVTMVAVAPFATAHEVRPAYLQLDQTAADTYDVFWKVPGRGDMRLGLDVVLPDGSIALSLPRSVFRSEEHTSELQSHVNLVCRLLLEKKKNKNN